MASGCLSRGMMFEVRKGTIKYTRTSSVPLRGLQVVLGNILPLPDAATTHNS